MSPRQPSLSTKANNNKRRGRGRPVPSPKPILDRQALLQALDAADIVVKKEHMDGFYQALHRHRYPPLPEFVEQYYQNETECLRTKAKPSSPDNKSSPDNHQNYNNNNHNDPPSQDKTTTDHQNQNPPVLHLKNAVTNRKNRNRTNLPKAFLQFLADPHNNFATVTSKVVTVKTSADRSTTKLAVQLHDGQLVESVLMRYGPKLMGKGVEGSNKHNKGNTTSLPKCGRASLCVSSQVGCAMGCNFCATGMMGLTGDLNVAEILEQVVHAERILAQEALERRTLRQRQEPATPVGDDERDTANKTNTKPMELASDLDVVRNIVFMGKYFKQNAVHDILLLRILQCQATR